jgi:hypothetical protein
MQSEGYPDDKYALQRVADELRVPARTLRRWFNGENGQPPDDVVRDSKKELAELFDAEIRAIMDYLPSARLDASYRDLVTGAAILTDKKQLLTGAPTDRSEVSSDGALEVRVVYVDEQE